jgi:predicted deacylase
MAFLGVDAPPGESTRRRVPIADLADGTPITVPVAIVRGVRDGPTVYLQAGLHGDEQTGIEICRRFLSELDPADIAGTVVVVPVANVPAHLSRTRGYLHEERWLVDINRIFPGSPGGLLTARIAHVLFTEFVMAADFTIDLHSALDGCDIVPFGYVDPDDDQGGSLALRERVATSLGTPYVWYKPRSGLIGTSDMTHSLGNQADAAGKPTVTIEMGESRRVTVSLVPLGVRAIHNAFKVLGVEEGEPVVPTPPRRFSTFSLVHASRGGGLRLFVDLGDEVSAGDVIGQVADVFGDPIEELRAPASGFVLRVMRLGAVNTGAETAWIAQ